MIIFIVTTLFGCTQKKEQHSILLATTTSTDNSGLLDYLIPYFEEDTGIEVKWIAVGTGAALEMGRTKEVDILMVHDKTSELIFMQEGYGLKRSDLMYNDFVIVGPVDSGIDNTSLSTVLTEIKNGEFISRGDTSGTHAKELMLWEKYGIENTGSWYIESGQGMGATLSLASEKGSYTLTDRATFLTMKDTLDLKIVFENDTDLFNQYGVITVMPHVDKVINDKDALILYDWLISNRGQYLISQFGIETYGQPLFFID